MKLEEARLLLECFRTGEPAADDPQVAAALALAQSDPELKKWFAEQRAFDAQISEEVHSIPVPLDLREKLLALHSSGGRGSIRWLAPVLARAAIIAVFGIAGAMWWRSRPMEFSTLRHHVLEQSWGTAPHLAFQSKDWNEVRAWLAGRDVKQELKIPAGLQEARLHGCALVTWHGHAVPVLCFSEGHRHMHLYVMDRAELVDVPPGDKPQFDKYGPMGIASWTRADKAYVLTGFNTESFFKKFRKSGRWIMSG